MYITERCQQISLVKLLITGSQENLLVFAKLTWFNRNYISYTHRKANLQNRYAKRACICAKCWQFVDTVVIVVEVTINGVIVVSLTHDARDYYKVSYSGWTQAKTHNQPPPAVIQSSHIQLPCSGCSFISHSVAMMHTCYIYCTRRPLKSTLY